MTETSDMQQVRAELAIVRLRKEIEELTGRKTEMQQQSPRPSQGVGCVWILTLLMSPVVALFGIFYWGAGFSAVGPIFVVGAILVLISAVVNMRRDGRKKEQAAKRWDETTGVELKALDEQVAAKQAELTHYQEIVALKK